MSEFLGYADILKGVGEIIVDEAKLALHFLTDQLRHATPSEHFREPSKPSPIHLNRWEDEAYESFKDIDHSLATGE